jgi:tRNA pseudouridine55 synthase
MAPSEASGGAGHAHPHAMDGILVLAKPPGPTSHDMVGLVRRLAATRRVGHGGTLDPFASGVLPIFLGRATRVVEYHLADRKRYRATVCFGATSSTDDLEGTIEAVAAPAPDRSAVEAALGAFLGVIEQRPPDYSAVKVAGRRAYAMARAGQRPDLRPRSVTIHAIELVEWDGTDPERPVAVIEVECSAGTYIRALARDLGGAVGSGAYLGALTRSASGPFRLDDAVSVDALRAAAAAGPDRVRALLLPAEMGLERFPRMILEPREVAAIARGQFVRPGRPVPAAEPDGHIRLVDTPDRLVAIAAWRDGRLAPEKVLVDVPARAGDD